MMNSLPTTEVHWSHSIAADLLARFAGGENDLVNPANAAVHELCVQLGEALDVGHTVVALTSEQMQLFTENTHPLVAVLPHASEAYVANHSHKAEKQNQRHQPFSMSNKPIIIQNQLAYFHRQWWQENTLANKIHTLLAPHESQPSSTNINRPNIKNLNISNSDTNSSNTNRQAKEQPDLSHLPSNMYPEQKAAIKAALSNRFTLITGGPGTGKTWTVAQLVLTLLRDNPKLNIALAAPTGKAAQRMQEALNQSINDSINKSINSRLTSEATKTGSNTENTAAANELLKVVKTQLDQAKTIHRLLGLGYGSTARFHESKPLPYDLVIIDEASMLGVALANQLMQAIGTHTKVVLLGDANQLAAVDAGAVLADLCSSPALKQQHICLTQSRRFTADSGVGQLATAVLENNPTAAQAAIKNYADISHTSPNTADIYQQLWQPFLAYAEQLKPLYAKPSAEQQSGIKKLFEMFDGYRILTATHAGKLGGHEINQQMSQRLISELALTQLAAKTHWFHGRPVMMLHNDYQLTLANGDIGIALLDHEGNYQVHFPSLPKPLAANRLSENTISTAFAMTIHKSQGSEFSKVAMLLDAPAEQTSTSKAANLLSRELVYTAITRAKKQVAIYATESTLTGAIQTKSLRQTGLGVLLGRVVGVSSLF